MITNTWGGIEQVLTKHRRHFSGAHGRSALDGLKVLVPIVDVREELIKRRLRFLVSIANCTGMCQSALLEWVSLDKRRFGWVREVERNIKDLNLPGWVTHSANPECPWRGLLALRIPPWYFGAAPKYLRDRRWYDLLCRGGVQMD